MKYLLPIVFFGVLVSIYFFLKPASISQEEINKVFSSNNVQAITDSNYNFLQTIGDQSEIIAIGEATHGSREFNLLRFNFFKFLIEKCDYNVFFLEAEFTAVLPLNKYIETGSGDPKQLLTQTGNWLLNNYDVLNEVKWMRSYNQNHKKKLQLYGVDMRNFNLLLFEIKSFFIKKKTRHSTKILSDISKLYRLESKSGESINVLKELQSLFAEDISTAIKQSYLPKTDLINFYLVLLNERINLFETTSDDQSIRLRDQFMAENILWLIRNTGQNQKGIFGAHDMHVSKYKNPATLTLFKKDFTGSYLKAALGNKYFTIFTDFAQGYSISHNSKLSRLTSCYIPINKQTISYALQSSGKPTLFLNIKKLSRNASKILNKQYLFNSLGSIYENELNNTEKYNLVEQYDGYVYIPSVSATEPIKIKYTL